MQKDKYGFPKGSHRAAAMQKFTFTPVPKTPIPPGKTTQYRGIAIALILQGFPKGQTTAQLANWLGLKGSSSSRSNKIRAAIANHNAHQNKKGNYQHTSTTNIWAVKMLNGRAGTKWALGKWGSLPHK